MGMKNGLRRVIVRFGLLAPLFAALFATAAASAQQLDWQLYRDPATGYRIELPVGLLDRVEDSDRMIRLRDDARGIVLQVYDGINPDGLSLSEFIAFLSEADRIAEVTYRTGGQSWFVISGYYRRDDTEPGPLIFYAKFMFSAGLERFAAFEISYPEDLKRELDPIIERLEASLRAPD